MLRAFPQQIKYIVHVLCLLHRLIVLNLWVKQFVDLGISNGYSMVRACVRSDNARTLASALSRIYMHKPCYKSLKAAFLAARLLCDM